MNDELDQAAVEQLRRCVHQPRYRVAWLVGPPRRGKTRFARAIAQQQGWRYLDYTLTPGYFDTLQTTIAAYQPAELVAAIQAWCEQTTASVLVVDELDALLACWTLVQRKVWASQMARLAYLPCGLLLVTHVLAVETLMPILPDSDPRYCLTF